MLRRCLVLEEMFLRWSTWSVASALPTQLPTIPLHHLRKLLLHSIRTDSIKCLLHAFDFKANGIVIPLSDVRPEHSWGSPIPAI